MGKSTMFNNILPTRLLVGMLCVCSCLRLTSQQSVDASVVNATDSRCLNGTDIPIPTNIQVVAIRANTATVSWQQVDPTPQAYEVLYRLMSSTSYQVTTVNTRTSTANSVSLSGLDEFTSYAVAVRVGVQTSLCYGNASGEVPFTTNKTAPNGPVTNLTAITEYNGDTNVVHFSWDPLPEDQWNGLPFGYFVYLYLGQKQINAYTAIYPSSFHVVVLRNNEYSIQVVAVNDVGLSAPERLDFTIGDVSGPTSSGNSALDYPYVYILIPGLICVVIIVVVTIVIFKKVYENNKRSVAYCRDIQDKPNNGFVNAIPLNNLSPTSPVMSVSLSNNSNSATPSATSAPPQHIFLVNRPLPLSPNSSSTPAIRTSPTVRTSPTSRNMEQEIPPFGNNLASNYPPARKMPHPGPLPQLDEAAEPGFASIHHRTMPPHSGGQVSETGEAGFVPMQRTLTNQSDRSVFSPSVASAPTQPQQNHRNRAKTVGSIPSPYEVPENGNTLPRNDMPTKRPSSAHAHSAAHHRTTSGSQQVVLGGHIPPPPAHSPPPLTQSSMEIRARMAHGDQHHHHGILGSPPGGLPGQHTTLPRTLGNQRSYSTTNTSMNGSNRSAINRMKSEGQLPCLEAHEEKLVYIQAPLDSSIEASIHSASSYGQSASDRRPSLERGPYLHSHNGIHTNGSLVGSEQFSSFSEMTDPGSVTSGVGVAKIPPHHAPLTLNDRERSSRSRGRESIFSETSTELSISSASEREVSPGWTHRGTTSDIGIGQRGTRSRSPPDRETHSEVGSGLKSEHHVFKKV